MAEVERKQDAPRPRGGPFRSILRIMVEADRSRSIFSRARSLLVLIALLAAFGFAGYLLPAVVSRYW